MSKTFDQLQDVIEDAEFPALDLALRRGVHVDRDAAGWYTLLSEAQALLEAFYRRYGCELVHKADGYYYLLPTSDQLPRRQLASPDMLVGQALALLYLDPISLERGGLVTREQVIEQLVAALGTEALMAAFVPKRKRKDEQAAQRQVRAKIAESVRRLAALGFAEALADEQLRLRPALLRFAEPVRGLAEPAEALAKLVAQGEVAVVDDEAELEAQASDEDASELEADAEGEEATDDGEGPDTHPSANRSDNHEAESAGPSSDELGDTDQSFAQPDHPSRDNGNDRGNDDFDAALSDLDLNLALPDDVDRDTEDDRAGTDGVVDDPLFAHRSSEDRINDDDRGNDDCDAELSDLDLNLAQPDDAERDTDVSDADAELGDLDRSFAQPDDIGSEPDVRDTGAELDDAGRSSAPPKDADHDMDGIDDDDERNRSEALP